MIFNLQPFDATNVRGKLYGIEFDFAMADLSYQQVRINVAKWCNEMYGIGYKNYSSQPDCPFSSRWVNDIEYGIIKFKEEADFMHFMLVWDR